MLITTISMRNGRRSRGRHTRALDALVQILAWSFDHSYMGGMEFIHRRLAGAAMVVLRLENCFE